MIRLRWLAAGAGALLAMVAWRGVDAPKESLSMLRKSLSPEEERVIVEKGTELPFTGALLHEHDPGEYRCKQCGAPLFPSSAKFDSHTGWPSFDDAFAGAVKRIADPDGRRTEIVCARCGGHLGHVFSGENMTAKNTRYCVNSISLDFEPAAAGDAAASPDANTAGASAVEAPGPVAAAYFAGGCFWGVEYYFKQQPGVLSAETGYMGGDLASPSYKDVCAGRTGHAETVKVSYDPTRVSYEQLARLFFEIHDPTQVDRQGPDVGTQYRSVVFYATPDQQRIANRLIQLLEAKGSRVATKLVPAGPFWKAEDYHQDYYFKTGKKPYCHVRVRRFD